MVNKCNFGCGSIRKEGWIGVDKEDFGQFTIGSTELFEDNYFDMIVAHCSLQMNEYHEIVNVLKELRRVLKPNGVLRISLPDIITGFQMYNKGNIEWFPNGEENIDMRFSSWLTWYSSTRTLLTQAALRLKLLEAGFTVSDSEFGKTALSTIEICELDSRCGEVYFIEARK